MENSVLFATAFIFGSTLASFGNVLIHRLPQMILAEGGEGARPLTLSVPPSHCPSCRAPIRWYHNIPILGFLLLGGRCTDCRTRIPLRYLFVEVAGGVLCLAALWRFGMDYSAIAGSVFLLTLLVLSVIDLETGLLPDLIVFPVLVLGLLFGAANITTDPQSAFLGAAIGFAALFGLNAAYSMAAKRDGMGRGDFKMAALIGCWVGFPDIALALMVAFMIGTALAIPVMVLRGQAGDTSVPFGPFLAVGGALVFLAPASFTDTLWRCWINACM